MMTSISTSRCILRNRSIGVALSSFVARTTTSTTVPKSTTRFASGTASLPSLTATRATAASKQSLQKLGWGLLRRWSSSANIPAKAAAVSVVPFADKSAVANTSRPPTFTRPQIFTNEDGRQMIAFDMRPHPKLKPSIVARRLGKMRTYEGKERNIRHSPWRLNLVCQFAAKLPLQEALTQLEFSKKSKAPLVQKVLKRTSNLADIRDGLQISQLEVAECFATKGTPLKRVKRMGRGRMGRMERKHSHMRVVLREIDFPLKIYQAQTLGQKRRWFLLQQQAEKDYARAAAERAEIARLERENKE